MAANPICEMDIRMGPKESPRRKLCNSLLWNFSMEGKLSWTPWAMYEAHIKISVADKDATIISVFVCKFVVRRIVAMTNTLSQNIMMQTGRTT